MDLAILEGYRFSSTAFRRKIIAEGVENIEQGEILKLTTWLLKLHRYYST